MPELPQHQLQLQPRHLALLCQMLHQYLPQADVWAYGSRVTGQGHDASDLDLVVRQPDNFQQEMMDLWKLQDALIDSNLPIHVDVIDWARIAESFRHEIERAYVVLQKGNAV
ncbi:MAG: nucleotidyltransferase family protein [Burkholderiaceae bacterium]